MLNFYCIKRINTLLKNQFNVSIAVVDETGTLLCMKRMDGVAPMTANLAVEKAKCSAMSRSPSKLFEDIRVC